MKRVLALALVATLACSGDSDEQPSLTDLLIVGGLREQIDNGISYWLNGTRSFIPINQGRVQPRFISESNGLVTLVWNRIEQVTPGEYDSQIDIWYSNGTTQTLPDSGKGRLTGATISEGTLYVYGVDENPDEPSYTQTIWYGNNQIALLPPNDGASGEIAGVASAQGNVLSVGTYLKDFVYYPIMWVNENPQPLNVGEYDGGRASKISIINGQTYIAGAVWSRSANINRPALWIDGELTVFDQGDYNLSSHTFITVQNSSIRLVAAGKKTDGTTVLIDMDLQGNISEVPLDAGYSLEVLSEARRRGGKLYTLLQVSDGQESRVRLFRNGSPVELFEDDVFIGSFDFK